MYKPSDIANSELLSSYLRTSTDQLDRFVNGNQNIIDWQNKENIKAPSADRDKITVFERFYIPKRNKSLGYRIVYKPWDQFTFDILKVLKFNLTELYKPEDCVHGFVSNRSTRSNAIVHLGQKHLLKLDIKNFFESLKIDSVKDAFVSLGFKEDIAIQLSRICTLEEKLVQGFPTSPVLANIISVEMDKRIHKLCKDKGALYTRYADDMSISSDSMPQLVEGIKQILAAYGLELNPLKTQRFKRGQNQYVTGLSITDKLYPRIPKPVKRRLRQHLHYIKTYGYHSHICHLNDWDESTDASVSNELISKARNNIKGWINYIHSIEPKVAKNFYSIYNSIEEADLKRMKKAYAKFMKETDGVITLDLESKKPIPKRGD